MINNTNNVPKIIAVVPAAGIGSRMLSEQPKQYLTIGTQTLLEHSIASLLVHPWVNRVIVVLRSNDVHFQRLTIAKDRRITAVIGGRQRADSVLAGLLAAEDAEWVLVHDAVRPCLHVDDLSRLLALAETSCVGGILATPVRDTMKRADPHKAIIAHTVERECLWHALTPQFFPLDLLRHCLQQALREGATITDEASVLEYCGYHPELVIGRSDNIKVTQPEDLSLVAYFIKQR